MEWEFACISEDEAKVVGEGGKDREELKERTVERDRIGGGSLRKRVGAVGLWDEGEKEVEQRGETKSSYRAVVGVGFWGISEFSFFFLFGEGKDERIRRLMES